MRISLIASLAAVTLIGCSATTQPPVDREGRLLTLAAEEAQQIKDSTDRLTRQLNFAAGQLARDNPQEARRSLAYAATTLTDATAQELTPQIRIAGWISISELSRAAKDKTTAKNACDQAVTVLKSLPNVTERPDYVVGVANEVESLDGKPAAAKLLEESATWISPIPDRMRQRIALVAICDQIFRDDDYDGGLAVLRTDKDATWRSDTLAMLAERRFEPESVTQSSVADNRSFRDANGNAVSSKGSHTLDWVSNVGNAAVPGSIPSSPAEAGATTPFGKRVDFQSVFEGRIGRSEPPTTRP